MTNILLSSIYFQQISLMESFRTIFLQYQKDKFDPETGYYQQ